MHETTSARRTAISITKVANGTTKLFFLTLAIAYIHFQTVCYKVTVDLACSYALLRCQVLPTNQDLLPRHVPSTTGNQNLTKDELLQLSNTHPTFL